MLQQTYGEHGLSHTQCQYFESGRTPIKGNPKSGWPSISKEVHAVIRVSCCLTVCEVPEEVGISQSSCHMILTSKLKIHCISTKFELRLLIDEQKENRVTIS